MLMYLTGSQIGVKVKNISNDSLELWYAWCDTNLNKVLNDWFGKSDWTGMDMAKSIEVIDVHVVNQFKEYLKDKDLLED